MVQIALAEDATEAEEIQALLDDAGIESAVQSDDDSGSLKVFVPEAAVEAAQDVDRAADRARRADRGARKPLLADELEPGRADEAGAHELEDAERPAVGVRR